MQPGKPKTRNHSHSGIIAWPTLLTLGPLRCLLVWCTGWTRVLSPPNTGKPLPHSHVAAAGRLEHLTLGQVLVPGGEFRGDLQ